MPEGRYTGASADGPARPDLMTVADVQVELGIGRDSVLRLVREGHLAKIPHLRKTLIHRDVFEAYIRGDRSGTNGDRR